MSDITYEIAYVTTQDEKGRKTIEPALGIKKVMSYGMSPVYAIPLSRAWVFNEPEYMAREVYLIAKFLNMFADSFLLYRIAKLILEQGIPDLINAKPYTQELGKECGEGKLIINDQIQHFGITTTGKVIH